MTRILLTTTSYQDTPGPHHDLLSRSGFEVVRARGPLTEAEMLELLSAGEAALGEGAGGQSGAGGFDGLLNGDDHITARVIDAALPRLKVIAKYGIGLDSIDVAYATSKKLPVLFTPGVNHTTVAEHAIGLMIALAKGFYPHIRSVKAGGWKRVTGHELAGRTLGVLGMGRIGKEVLTRGAAMGMGLRAFDPYWDTEFADRLGVERDPSVEALLSASDVVSLHLGLSDATRGLIDARRLRLMKPGSYLINTARGGLVVEADIAEACRSGHLAGYGGDVLDHEPPEPGHPFNELDNVIITPHIGSRTVESVERQAVRATRNLVNFLSGDPDYIQANRF